MKVIYLLGYGDCECWNIIGAFSTREKAEEHLAPYRELEKQYGENFISGFYPSIQRIFVDDSSIRTLEFITRVRKIDENHYHAFTKLREEWEERVESSDRWYKTSTVNKEEAIEEARAYFNKLKEFGIEDYNPDDEEDIDIEGFDWEDE